MHTANNLISALNVMLLRAIFRGSTFIILKKFTLPDFCSLVQRYRTTLAIVAPPIVLALAKVPDVSKYDLSSLRKTGIISAAAPLSKELIDALWARLRIPIKQGMGMTEAAPCTQVQAWSSCMQHPGSVGKLVPNSTAKIIAVETATTNAPRELGPGEAGELWFRGPNVFLGYLNRPEATADCVTKDGYYRTGDIGYVDAEGNFFVTDRLKELIKYKGFQVPPAELEALLLTHPKIVDAGVVGVWREDQASEVPLAFVVPTPGTKRDRAFEEEVKKWVADKAAPYKRLRGGVRFLDAIPKNPTGKILRRVLRDQIQAEARKAKL
jgi:4-coumarate--CoA ligase